MEWAKREYSFNKIKWAGSILTEPAAAFDDYEHALEIVNNWRAAHHYPLNTFKVTLRAKSAEVDPQSLVAQRIKRLSSIVLKLERFPTMRLSQMQDIGGCRSIVTNIGHVRQLLKKYENSDLKHTLHSIDDYISNPKPSGYRGVHLIYKCLYDKSKSSAYNGQYIEMQIRSRQQHAWATAVETVGTFLNQSLKSSRGEDEWLRFFELMGSVIALHEKAQIVPNTPNNKSELLREVKEYAEKLNVEHTLQMFGAALRTASDNKKRKGDYFFLLLLQPRLGQMTIHSFPKKSLEEATERYLKIEKEIADDPSADAVLVSADSFNALQRAYPNYFLDTHLFLSELKRALK